MLDFKKKNKSHLHIYSKILILILCVVVIFLANATWNAYQKYSLAKRNMNYAFSVLSKFTEREKRLKEDMESLHSKEGIEALLRQRFNIAKDGEEMIIIIDGKEEQNSYGYDSQEASLWDALRGIFKRD